MINKLLFILFLFLFTSLSSNAQVIYPTWEWAVTDTSVQVNDWRMYEHHFYTVGFNQFTRWDTNGNKLLTNKLVHGKQLLFDYHHHAFVLDKMTSDSLVFPNITLYKQGTSDVLMYKLDTLGNILWVKNLGGPLADDCNQFCIDYQDNLYLTGYIQGTNGIHKLDSSGSYLWSKEIEDMNGAGSVVYRHIAYSQFDSTIVIGGSYVDTFHLDLLAVFDCYSNPNDPNQPSDNYLAKLDLNGHAIFLKSCAQSCQWSDGFYEIAIKPSTGEIFAISWNNSLSGTNSGLGKWSPSGVPISGLTSGLSLWGSSYGIGGISFDQDSLLGLLYHSPTEPYVFKIYNSINCNLVKTYYPTQPISPSGDVRLLFENGHIYFYGGSFTYTFYKMGIAPLSINLLSDANICSNSPTYNCNPIIVGGSPPYTFSWQPSIGVSNPNIVNPTITLSNSASYTLTVTDSLGYVAHDTINFNYYQSPLDSIISTSNLFPCYGDSSTIILHCANTSLLNQWYKNNILISNDADSIFAQPNNYYMLKTIDTISGCYVTNTEGIYYHPQIPTIIANSNNIALPSDTCFSPMLIKYQNFQNFGTSLGYWLKDGITIANQTSSVSVTSPGQYVLKIVDMSCELSDSIDFLPKSYDTLNASVCANQLPYQWQGQFINSAGSYNDTLQNINGCDSIITLQLVVNPNVTFNQNEVICSNQLPFVWNGQTIMVSGTYSNLSIGSNGCDSNTVLNLTVMPPPLAVINWNGFYLATSSFYTSYQWLLNGNPINGANDSTYLPVQNGNYQVVVSDNNSCSDTSVIFPFLTTEVSHVDHPKIFIIPNPAKDLATLYFDHEFTGTVQVLDSHGQTMETYVLEKVQSKNLDVSHYANGIYLIKVLGEHENEVMKLRVDRD